MRDSNKFTQEKAMAGLYGHRDKELMEYQRKSLEYRHHDL